jgi:glycine/D-amino acid oxidase-like deaminating enzyme
MPSLLVVGGGLFGSIAAAHARSQGIEALVFDAGLQGAASPAAAGLFKMGWMGKRYQDDYRTALPVLDRLYGIRHVCLAYDDGRSETLLCVPPTVILEPSPRREAVTTIGEGWLEAGARRYEGWVYVAAGVWSGHLVPGLSVRGKAGSALVFPGERVGRIRPVAPGRQAIAFVRDAGTTHFSDGTAELDYKPEHDHQTRQRAAEMGLTAEPIRRYWGYRPYAPGGPVFRQLGDRLWLATGGRKMGTILGASFAHRLVETLRAQRQA